MTTLEILNTFIESEKWKSARPSESDFYSFTDNNSVRQELSDKVTEIIKLTETLCDKGRASFKNYSLDKFENALKTQINLSDKAIRILYDHGMFVTR